MFQCDFTLRGVDAEAISLNLDYARVKVGPDFSVLDAVFDIRLDPVLHRIGDFATPMDQGHAGARPPQFEGRNRGRVFRADYGYVMIVVRVRLLVVVEHLRQIFAGHIQPIGDVIVAGGKHDFARLVDMLTSESIRGENLKGPVLAADTVDALILPNIE